MGGMNKIKLAAIMSLIAVTSILGESPALAQEDQPAVEQATTSEPVQSLPITGTSLVEGAILLGIGLFLAGLTVFSCRPSRN